MCRAIGAFWLVSPTGKLTIKRQRDKADTALVSTALSSLGDAQLVDDDPEVLEPQQGPVVHTVKALVNYDAITQRHLTTVDVVDQEIKALFPEEPGTLEFSSKFLSMGDGVFRAIALADVLERVNPMEPGDLLVMLRRRMLASTRTRVLTTMRFGWDALLVNPGDIIFVTNPASRISLAARSPPHRASSSASRSRLTGRS